MNKFNIPTYNILKLEKEMQNGKTDPLLFQTERGFYVVKTIGNVDGPKVLINEFVCYKLAKLLDVPIPDAALIKIDQNAIDADPILQRNNITPGIHFGSEFIKKSQPSVQPPLINIVQNQDDIPSIIMFDQIIYNNDRTQNL
ncbi:HipA family kinase [Virgibacillus halophilus]|uniref:HipA family kinase n=1 Tax=Tigheibacillus halophilus TaxID=361280 RepID=A0ABU5C6U5_9BACI|nr:HipA family kinase [Virgibacillus halophilus]